MAPGTIDSATNVFRHVLASLARLVGQPARSPERLPADLLIEGDDVEWLVTAPAPLASQPPPIPAEALAPASAVGRPPSAQERAWQELMSGRHPRLIIDSLSRATPDPA
jgi:hypothetical protein